MGEVFLFVHLLCEGEHHAGDNFAREIQVSFLSNLPSGLLAIPRTREQELQYCE